MRAPDGRLWTRLFHAAACFAVFPNVASGSALSAANTFPLGPWWQVHS